MQSPKRPLGREKGKGHGIGQPQKSNCLLLHVQCTLYTLIKRCKVVRKGILIYEEMRKYLTMFEEAVSHIWLFNRSLIKKEIKFPHIYGNSEESSCKVIYDKIFAHFLIY